MKKPAMKGVAVTDPQLLIGHAVQYVLDGEIQFFGIAEYVAFGWVGIRQPNGRLDEARIEHVEMDPT